MTLQDAVAQARAIIMGGRTSSRARSVGEGVSVSCGEVNAAGDASSQCAGFRSSRSSVRVQAGSFGGEDRTCTTGSVTSSSSLLARWRAKRANKRASQRAKVTLGPAHGNGNARRLSNKHHRSCSPNKPSTAHRGVAWPCIMQHSCQACCSVVGDENEAQRDVDHTPPHQRRRRGRRPQGHASFTDVAAARRTTLDDTDEGPNPQGGGTSPNAAAEGGRGSSKEVDGYVDDAYECYDGNDGYNRDAGYGSYGYGGRDGYGAYEAYGVCVVRRISSPSRADSRVMSLAMLEQLLEQSADLFRQVSEALTSAEEAASDLEAKRAERTISNGKAPASTGENDRVRHLPKRRLS